MIVVEFATEWCNRCKEVSPVIQKLASEHESIKFLKIDADIEGVGEKYLINGVPTIIFFRVGMEVNRIKVPSDSKVDEIEKVSNKIAACHTCQTWIKKQVMHLQAKILMR